MYIKKKLLTAFLSIAIVSILSVAVLSFFSSEGALLRASTQHLETLVAIKADTIQTFFHGLEEDISIAQDYYNIKTNLPVVSKFSKDRTAPEYIKAKEILDVQLRKWFKIKKYINDIELVSPEGEIVYSANEEHGRFDLDRPLLDPSGMAFEEGKKGIFISPIFQAPDELYGYKFGLFVTAPVFDFQKQFIGVVAFEIDMGPIYKLIQDATGLGKTGETLVVSAQGDHILFLNPLRHAPDAALKRKIYFGEKIGIPGQESVTGKPGFKIGKDYRGEEVLGAWRYLPTLHWGIVAKRDLREVLAPVVTLRNHIAVFCFVIIIFVVIASLRVAQSISEPIHLLHKGTEIIGSGNLDYKVGTDVKDEIGQLSRAFDQMTEDLKKTTASRDELNKEISQRKLIEEKIKRLSNIVEYSSDAIIGQRLDGTILDWNAGAEEMYGYSHGDAEGRNISIIVPPEKIDELFNIFEKIKRGEMIRPVETRRCKKDGSCVDVSLTVSHIKDETGNVIGFSTICRDISERKKAERAIEDMTNQLQAVVEFVGEGITFSDNSGKFLVYNRRMQAITGYTQDEANNSGDFTRLLYPNPLERQKALQRLQKIVEHKVTLPLEVETTIQAKDGTKKVLWVSTVEIRFKDQEMFLSIYRDITERKEFEKKLIATAQEWETTFNSIRDMVSIQDVEYRLVKVNKAYADFFKMKPEELAGKNCYSIAHGTSEPIEGCPCQRIIGTKGPGNFEYFEPRFGIYFEVTVSPIFNENKDLIGFVHVIKNITERKQTEKKLAQMKEQEYETEKFRVVSLYARSLLEASLDPLVTISREGKITDVNEATIKATGISREKLIGTDFADYFTEPEKAREGYQQVFKKGFVSDYPLTIRHKNGKLINVLYNATVYKDDKGNARGVFAAARDVTKLNDLQDRLVRSEKLAVVGKLASSVAHELRNPLGVIRNVTYYLNMLEVVKDSPKLKENLDIIDQEIENSDKVITDLLEYSRAKEPILVPENINLIVKEVLDRLRIPQNIELVLELKDDLPKIKVDALQMQQLFYNITKNAVEAMEKGGKLRIKTALKENAFVEVSVLDAGPGIPPENMGKIFDPLFSTKAKGTGLGLSVCLLIVERHNGKIEVDSEVGKGTTFRVKLPIKKG